MPSGSIKSLFQPSPYLNTSMPHFQHQRHCCHLSLNRISIQLDRVGGSTFRSPIIIQGIEVSSPPRRSVDTVHMCVTIYRFLCGVPELDGMCAFQHRSMAWLSTCCTIRCCAHMSRLVHMSYTNSHFLTNQNRLSINAMYGGSAFTLM